MEIYQSEREIIKEYLQPHGSEQPKKGTLYGLWTHAGKVVVQLAVSDDDTKSVEACVEQKLRDVGKFTTSSDLPNRPRYASTLKYFWIHHNRAKVVGVGDLQCYNVDGQGRLSHVEEKVLPYISPYRYVKDPDAFTYNLAAEKISMPLSESGVRRFFQSGPLENHWVRQPEHSQFLRNLTATLQNCGLNVRQVQQSGSDYIALHVEWTAKNMSWAIGFPTDFPWKREVSIAGKEELKSAKFILSRDVRQAVIELTTEMGIR